MGAKSSKSKIDDSKCSKYCTLVYGPELSEDSISNDKWTLECTVQVEKSVDHTYFGAIGWKPGGYFGIQVCYFLAVHQIPNFLFTNLRKINFQVQ